MVFSRAVKIQPDLVTEKALQVGQTYASHDIALSVSQTGCMSGEIVTRLRDYNERRNIKQSIFVLENNIQRVSALQKFGLIRALRISCLVIKENM